MSIDRIIITMIVGGLLVAAGVAAVIEHLRGDPEVGLEDRARAYLGDRQGEVRCNAHRLTCDVFPPPPEPPFTLYCNHTCRLAAPRRAVGPMSAPTVADSCMGKEGFDTGDLARTVAARMRARRGAKVEPYRCRFCSRWHLGGKLPPVRRARG